MAASNIKLVYFDIKGLGEAIRIALHAAKVNFEDVRVSKDEWEKLKPTTPLGQLPVLEIDGTRVCQSSAILRYAGRLSKLYPDDARQAMAVDEILGIVGDIRVKLAATLYEQDEGKKAEMRAKLANDFLPQWFTNFEKLLAAKGTAFSAGTSLSVADLEIMVLAEWLEAGVLDGIPADIMGKYPVLMSVVKKSREHPQVQAYYNR